MDFLTNQTPWYVPMALLLAALLVGLIKAYQLWQDMHEDDEPVSDRERLSELEEAHFAGELDADELRRVRELLSGSKSSSAPEPSRRPPPSPPESPPATSHDASAPGDSPGEPDPSRAAE